jgi:hypothetical protein
MCLCRHNTRDHTTEVLEDEARMLRDGAASCLSMIALRAPSLIAASAAPFSLLLDCAWKEEEAMEASQRSTRSGNLAATTPWTVRQKKTTSSVPAAIGVAYPDDDDDDDDVADHPDIRRRGMQKRTHLSCIRERTLSGYVTREISR